MAPGPQAPGFGLECAPIMILPPFELHQPRTIEEAVQLLARHGRGCDVLAGGSDLLPNYKQGLNAKPHVVSLEQIAELRAITPERLGAMARLADLARHPTIRSELRVIAETAAQVASPLIIEQATLGGNLLLDTRCFYFNQSLFWRESKGYCLKAEGDVCLVVPQKEVCYATNSSDLAPVLITLDAELHFRSASGERTVPIREFYRHDGIARHGRHADELLTFIDIPPAARRLAAGYIEAPHPRRDRLSGHGGRRGRSGSMPGAAWPSCTSAVGAVDTTPRTFEELTASFCGKDPNPEMLAEIADQVMARVKPYNNVPLSPTYRKRMVGVYLRRILGALVAEARQGTNTA